MNQAVRRAAGFLACVATALMLARVYQRYERQEAPRNTTSIVIFDQGSYKAETDTDPWALPGWDWGLDQHRSLATAGCHLIAYAHCVQWVTDTPRGDALLSELLTACKNPSDQEENSHATACAGLHAPDEFSKDAYDAFILSHYGIRTVELDQTLEALAAHFEKGGAVVTVIPGHYISAVELREIGGSYYVHVIDSNWGTARRKGYEMFYLDEGGNLVRILHIADGTYTSGSDYWMPYETYSEFIWKTAMLPPGA